MFLRRLADLRERVIKLQNGVKSSHRQESSRAAHRTRLVPSGLDWSPLNSSGPFWDWADPLRDMLVLQF